MQNIRNFCIIAHIDHGKSTLADRFLEVTGTVSKREMKEQLLDTMELERERGITIKLQPVRMQYEDHEINLIDTPGHVDFTYEVSRSLSAVEGAVLLVDATQGIQAQTLANLYLALEQNLVIIPVINKIDLPAADVEKTTQEIVTVLGCKPEEVIAVSAKTGQNVEAVLDAVIKNVPPPKPQDGNFKSLIFDSIFDEYKGIIAYVRVDSGNVKAGDEVKFFATGKEVEVLEVGYFAPKYKKSDVLQAGEIGYVITGVKALADCRVGDTLSSLIENKPLSGYKEIKPMVFAGLFCQEGNEYPRLREAVEKLKLNDSALQFEPENSPALGFGFRCGFLGLLHLEIIQQRLEQEFDLDLIVTAPSVAYQVDLTSGEKITVRSPQSFPDPSQIKEVREPVMKLDIFTPKNYLGAIMNLTSEKRGVYLTTEYVDEGLAILHYEIPMTAIIIDYYDKLKSVSSGYASLNYEFLEYRQCEIVKLDILVAEEREEALSVLTYKDAAYDVGRKIVEGLKEHIPRQMFMIKLQAAVGGKIIAAERISAMRKDVTAKLYGGDYTRRQKLLSKQKKGKKKMADIGRGHVKIPAKAFIEILRK
ncbi:MAG: elongation factor 4 [Candidatus Buchananbacteria bacterium CG10_big_fil_rev_8_21_14_0_10_42_9]|uniref:Elongation factor 4 n=1 Tax=Candidatus Buchananbacteria bacterium CG10_big_fil_rev_8_21_14_0_10_42_9 TaxID=1974526 RepID=A0A2H0W4F4_9BACT|nr:MAG: elongation factor 4 [Candidatus Buchananbacteria bacterium CG10_big_fil_rev_8_21_14_0_10_42_9]